jgi:hypothetical protein
MSDRIGSADGDVMSVSHKPQRFMPASRVSITALPRHSRFSLAGCLFPVWPQQLEF